MFVAIDALSRLGLALQFYLSTVMCSRLATRMAQTDLSFGLFLMCLFIYLLTLYSSEPVNG